jgi:hypothetical protein
MTPLKGVIPTVTWRMINWALPALALICSPAAPAHAAAFVLGDSLGVGVAQVAQVKGLAKISVHIRGPKAIEQLAQIPPGSTAFLVLGTNDANGSIAKLDKSIDDIVAAAEKRNLTLIWLGPPCVRKSWDTRARDLDVILREKLAGTSARYVSMRDEEMCSGAMHEPDGVHLRMKGYAHMWEKACAAAGIEVASITPPKEATGRTRTASAAPVKKSERIPLPVPRRPPPGLN